MARPRSAEARQKVLAAASDLMAARGVSSLTIDEVANRSGVAKTTIYRHWPERTSLIVDAINAQLEHVGTPDTGSLRGDLVAFFGGMMRTDLSGHVGDIIPSLIEAAGRDPEMASLLDRIGSQRRRVIELLLERAISRGEIEPRADLEPLVGVIVGPILYEKMIRRRLLTPEYVDACLEIVLAGLHSNESLTATTD
jgi:AcrR family transcriptional regulator